MASSFRSKHSSGTDKAVASLAESGLPGEGVLAPNRRQNILLAAERLFAQRGFHGVSIRDIAEEAGVPLALVGYYFGPKLSLYHDIFREHSPFIQARLDALAQVPTNVPPAQRLEAIITAWVAPVFQLATTLDGQYFLQLLKRALHEHIPEDEPVVKALFDPLAHAFIDALSDALPHAGRDTVVWCYQFALGALMNAVTDTRVERLSRGESSVSELTNVMPMFIRFITHGMRQACATPTH